MKTQNNNQETSKSQVSKRTLGSGAVLFGAVLISLSVNAQELWKEFSNSASYGKMALVMDGQLNETENADAAFEAINAEAANQLYHANAMLYAETETEESMQIENWMTTEEFFNSTDDVLESAKSVLELESWMTEKSFFTDAEQYTAHTADAEIANYANRLALEAEAEKALAIESWMTEESFFTDAERYTAHTADAEIANYANRLALEVETEEALAIESWMTTEEYFNSPEVLADEDSMKVESWMLEAENFTNQYPYVSYAIK